MKQIHFKACNWSSMKVLWLCATNDQSVNCEPFLTWLIYGRWVTVEVPCATRLCVTHIITFHPCISVTSLTFPVEHMMGIINFPRITLFGNLSAVLIVLTMLLGVVSKYDFRTFLHQTVIQNHPNQRDLLVEFFFDASQDGAWRAGPWTTPRTKVFYYLQTTMRSIFTFEKVIYVVETMTRVYD